MSLGAAAIALMVAGILLIGRELKRERPASKAALAGDVLAVTGMTCAAMSIALGPVWPLAFVSALCSVAGAVATVTVLRTRRKGLGR